MRLFVLTLMLCFLAACGQKGPLYLPSKQPPRKHHGSKPASAPTPAAPESSAGMPPAPAPAESSAAAPAPADSSSTPNKPASGNAAPAQP